MNRTKWHSLVLAAAVSTSLIGACTRSTDARPAVLLTDALSAVEQCQTSTAFLPTAAQTARPLELSFLAEPETACLRASRLLSATSTASTSRLLESIERLNGSLSAAQSQTDSPSFIDESSLRRVALAAEFVQSSTQIADAKFEACDQKAMVSLIFVKFDPVTTMRVGQPSKITVHVGLDSAAVSTATIPNATQTTVVTFPGESCEMVAQLHGSLFEIDKPDPQHQSFAQADLLTWGWNVTPTSTEAKELDVDFTPVMRTTVGERFGAAKTETVTIKVNAAPGKSLLSRFWKLLASGFAVVALGWVVYFLGPSKEGGGAARVARWWRERSPNRRRKPPPSTPSHDEGL